MRQKAGELLLRQGLGEADGALAVFPLPALLHELHAFKTLQNTALGTNGAAAGLETGML